ncbi:MAG: hypothetical protein TYPL_1740 [Candidatus Tyloplasma litorale]|nr:MAG: hypothetical protein TYPL_1740 [Mycoplasmatales bacterium]
MWIIIVLAIIGSFAIIHLLFKGSVFKSLIKFIWNIIILFILFAIIILIADLGFDAGWWETITNWFQSIGR